MGRTTAAGIALVGALVVSVLIVLGAGEQLSAPAHQVVGPPPPGLSAVPVAIAVTPSASVAGWFARGEPGRGAVLLLHGVRSNRAQMVPRARRLQTLGYAVLLIDLPAHGESDGARITFGRREADGVVAAMRFLRREVPGERIGVIGVSLGAASTVLAHVVPAPDAVVLESMYPTITEAVANRLATRFGGFGARLAPILLWQLPLRIDIDADSLRPIDHVGALHAPVLIASGVDDRYTTVAETMRLYDAASAPKELWLVPGAGHVDLEAFDPAGYQGKVFAFLSRHLHGTN